MGEGLPSYPRYEKTYCGVKMKNKARLLTFLSVAVLTLAGCSAPRGLDHRATRPVAQGIDAPQSEALQLLAEKLSPMNPGQAVTETMDGKSYQIEVVSLYVNALGESCKRLHLKSDTQSVAKKASICLNSEAKWRYIAPLQ